MVNVKEIGEHVKELADKVGEERTVDYLCHVLTRNAVNYDDAIMAHMISFAQQVRTTVGVGGSMFQAKPVMEEFCRTRWEHVPEAFRPELKHLKPPDEAVAPTAPPSAAFDVEFVRSLVAANKRMFDNEDPEFLQQVGTIVSEAVRGGHERLLVVANPDTAKMIVAKLEAGNFEVIHKTRKDGKSNITCKW